MNRFLISLCSLNQPGSSSSADNHFSLLSPVNFRVPESILDNIRQPLSYGAVADDADGDAEFIVEDTAEVAHEDSILPEVVSEGEP
jgi:hypothetical protein